MSTREQSQGATEPLRNVAVGARVTMRNVGTGALVTAHRLGSAMAPRAVMRSVGTTYRRLTVQGLLIAAVPAVVFGSIFGGPGLANLNTGDQSAAPCAYIGIGLWAVGAASLATAGWKYLSAVGAEQRAKQRQSRVVS